MGFNNEIQSTRKNVTEVLSKMRSAEFFVDKSFQRRLVWTDKQKVRLIETVFLDYPMPEIYLWEQVPNTDTGIQNHSIVDGQQRLTTLIQFASNEFKLKSIYLDEENKESDFSGKFWKDIDTKLKEKFLQYNLNCRVIPSNVRKGEIRQIFARINETDRSLNPQELRHATLHGEFLNAAREIADSVELAMLDIFRPNDIRRMADVEFASQLLGYQRKGIVSDTQANMNELYDEFSNEYPDSKSDTNRIKKTLRYIGSIFKNKDVEKFFKTQNYVYTLNCILDGKSDIDIEKWQIGLSEFAAKYNSEENTDENSESIDRNILSFRLGASSRTRSKASRTSRLFGLKKWLTDNYPELDV